jgi:hypothetical protein
VFDLVPMQYQFNLTCVGCPCWVGSLGATQWLGGGMGGAPVAACPHALHLAVWPHSGVQCIAVQLGWAWAGVWAGLWAMASNIPGICA